MTISLASLTPRAALAGSVLLAAAASYAATAPARPTTPARTPSAAQSAAQKQAQQRASSAARPAASTAARPGGTGGGAGSTSRQYLNSTMVGDALITSDAETRRIIVVTDDATNENIKTIIATLDRPKPQVLINVVFVQVTHSNDLDLGAEGTYRGTIAIKNEPTGIATTRFGVGALANDPLKSGAFYRILGEHGLDATLAALAARNKTEILSRPSILTRSSQQATIMVGQSVPIITNSRVSDQTNTTINTVQYQDVGIILRVTPFITAEGLVEMIVSPEISALSATTVPISNTVESPVIDRRAADTVVVTPSDQTVVIGGLISTQKNDRDSKVPLLGDIPILGYAFKRKVKSDVKTELLIFLTPHVVRTPGELANLSSNVREQMNLAPEAFKQGELERFLPQK
jgi:type II secretory pathway component GspD/PulD (secretin)